MKWRCRSSEIRFRLSRSDSSLLIAIDPDLGQTDLVEPQARGQRVTYPTEPSPPSISSPPLQIDSWRSPRPLHRQSYHGINKNLSSDPTRAASIRRKTLRIDPLRILRQIHFIPSSTWTKTVQKMRFRRVTSDWQVSLSLECVSRSSYLADEGSKTWNSPPSSRSTSRSSFEAGRRFSISGHQPRFRSTVGSAEEGDL